MRQIKINAMVYVHYLTLILCRVGQVVADRF